MKTCREDGREDGMSVGAHGEAAGADGVAEGAVENQRRRCTWKDRMMKRVRRFIPMALGISQQHRATGGSLLQTHSLPLLSN